MFTLLAVATGIVWASLYLGTRPVAVRKMQVRLFVLSTLATILVGPIIFRLFPTWNGTVRDVGEGGAWVVTPILMIPYGLSIGMGVFAASFFSARSGNWGGIVATPILVLILERVLYPIFTEPLGIGWLILIGLFAASFVVSTSVDFVLKRIHRQRPKPVPHS